MQASLDLKTLRRRRRRPRKVGVASEERPFVEGQAEGAVGCLVEFSQKEVDSSQLTGKGTKAQTLF